MSALIDLLTELTALRDRDALEACLVGAIRELMQADRVAVHRVIGDPGDEHWVTGACLENGVATTGVDASWVDLRELPLLASEPDWLACVRQSAELTLPVTATTPDGATVTLFPLIADAGAIGAVQVCTPLPPDDAARAAVRGLLRIYRNLQSLLDYSESDMLTSLLNRKSFDESFYKASALPLSESLGLSAERRQTGPLRYWLGVIDIDHFKLVNDQYGHLIGDEVLLLLSRVMRNSFRFLDKLYRFGGEEFVVLLRCRDEADALAALERFREGVANHVFPRVGHITVSVGFTDVRIGDTPPAAVERADLAVYHAKHHGRNQVHSHAALVRVGALADNPQTGDIEFF
jgi:diguanylate cyclase (GGDEF)-like protein